MASIIRGTTPPVKFTFGEISVSDITAAYFTIQQAGKTVIEKDLTTATIGEEDLLWTLTQEESLQLDAKLNALLICDWKLNDGTRGRSQVLDVNVGNPGKNEVI